MAQSYNYCKVHNFTLPFIYVRSFNQFRQVVSEFCSEQTKVKKKNNKKKKNNRNNDKYSMSPFRRRGDIIRAFKPEISFSTITKILESAVAE